MSSLLFLACLGILCPAAFSMASKRSANTAAAVLTISHAIGVTLFCIYGAYLFYQLKTHTHLFEDEKQGETSADQLQPEPIESDSDSSLLISKVADEPQKSSLLSMGGSAILLAAITIIVSVLAEWLVGSINSCMSSWNIKTHSLIAKFC